MAESGTPKKKIKKRPQTPIPTEGSRSRRAALFLRPDGTESIIKGMLTSYEFAPAPVMSHPQDATKMHILKGSWDLTVLFKDDVLKRLLSGEKLAFKDGWTAEFVKEYNLIFITGDKASGLKISIKIEPDTEKVTEITCFSKSEQSFDSPLFMAEVHGILKKNIVYELIHNPRNFSSQDLPETLSRTDALELFFSLFQTRLQQLADRFYGTHFKEIGVFSDFDHGHISVEKNGDLWILFHTQEFNNFDITKRNIVLNLRTGAMFDPHRLVKTNKMGAADVHACLQYLAARDTIYKLFKPGSIGVNFNTADELQKAMYYSSESGRYSFPRTLEINVGGSVQKLHLWFHAQSPEALEASMHDIIRFASKCSLEADKKT
jgi:hypothetical protein